MALWRTDSGGQARRQEGSPEAVTSQVAGIGTSAGGEEHGGFSNTLQSRVEDNDSKRIFVLNN